MHGPCSALLTRAFACNVPLVQIASLSSPHWRHVLSWISEFVTRRRASPLTTMPASCSSVIGTDVLKEHATRRWSSPHLASPPSITGLAVSSFSIAILLMPLYVTLLPGGYRELPFSVTALSPISHVMPSGSLMHESYAMGSNAAGGTGGSAPPPPPLPLVSPSSVALVRSADAAHSPGVPISTGSSTAASSTEGSSTADGAARRRIPLLRRGPPAAAAVTAAAAAHMATTGRAHARSSPVLRRYRGRSGEDATSDGAT
eukprot:356877-Chlamydomonas_euryale.AAC.3